jgi:mRNA interferase MazF
VLVSRESALAVKTKVTVAEVSTTVRGIPSEVPLGVADGLPRRCAANADHLVAISKTRLETRIARLRPDTLAALDEALRFSLGLA